MTNPTTISIAPDPSLIKKAFEHFGVPLGGALKLSADGRRWTFFDEEPDVAEVLGALVGQILADYVTGTMVIPSNVGTLRDVEHRLLGAVDDEDLADVTERLQGVITNLDGLLGPSTS